MPLLILLNPNDPLYDFEHQMAHRDYFAVMNPVNRFGGLPYQVDSPVFDAWIPAGDFLFRHQLAHDAFNATLPNSYSDGYTLETVTPIPPPTPPPPPYQQAHGIDGGAFGLPSHILLEGGVAPENRPWWTFLNHQEHYEANNAVLPIPATAPTTVGTGPGQANLSNPWWWAAVQPSYTGPLW